MENNGRVKITVEKRTKWGKEQEDECRHIESCEKCDREENNVGQQR
jgi:hypothetical protein